MEKIDGHVIYTNPWLTLVEDRVRHADGSTGVYSVVEKDDFSLVLPRWADGFWLVEQYRYPVRQRGWEFPQGSWPSGASGTLDDLARHELEEETGIRANKLDLIGRLFEAPGYSSQAFNVYLAEDLTYGEPHRELTEADMVHHAFTDAEIAELLRSGEIKDAASVAALALYQLTASN